MLLLTALQVLSDFKIFDCREWPKTRDELATYGNDSLHAIMTHYQDVLEFTEEMKVQVESQFSTLKGRLRSKRMLRSSDVVDAYATIIRQQDECFKYVIIVLKLLMTVSVSTVEVERGFSALNWIKTPQTATMSQTCLQSHLMVSLNTEQVGSFDANTAVLNKWMHAGKAARHIHGHKLTTRSDGAREESVESESE